MCSAAERQQQKGSGGAGRAHLCTCSRTKNERQHGKPVAKPQPTREPRRWLSSKPRLCHRCAAPTHDIFLWSASGKIGSILLALTFMTGLQSTCVYNRPWVASSRRLLLSKKVGMRRVLVFSSSLRRGIALGMHARQKKEATSSLNLTLRKESNLCPSSHHRDGVLFSVRLKMVR